MTRLPEIANPSRKPYPSDLSDAEWELLRPLLPQAKGFGHPVEVDFREILNGIFYVQRSGCQWEMMPHDLPPYSTVYRYFQQSALNNLRLILQPLIFYCLIKPWLQVFNIPGLKRCFLKLIDLMNDFWATPITFSTTSEVAS